MIRTDTDLLFTSSAKDYLKQHPIGFGAKVFRWNEGRWKWAKKLQRDPRINGVSNEMLERDSSAIRIGAVIRNHYFNNRFFEKNSKQHCPLPEIAIPTILHLLEGPDAKLQPP